MDHDLLMRLSYLGKWGQGEQKQRRQFLEDLQNLRQELVLEGHPIPVELQEAIKAAAFRIDILELAQQEIRDKYGELTDEDIANLKEARNECKKKMI